MFVVLKTDYFQLWLLCKSNMRILPARKEKELSKTFTLIKVR